MADDGSRESAAADTPSGASSGGSSSASSNLSDGAAATGSGSQISQAILLAIVVLAVPAALIGLIIFAVLPGPWWLGVLLGIIVAAVTVLVWLRRADELVLSQLGGGLHNADDLERLENMVQSLALAGGVEEPNLVVLSDQSRNALAVRNSGRNHLVVTQGLLASVGVVELEGLVAELLTRLRNGDAEAATVGAALFGRPILDSPLAPVLGPIGRLGLSRLLSADRDLEADRQAVSLTRYPPGLHGALSAVRRGDPRPASFSIGMAHLWLVDPTDAPTDLLDAERIPLGLRIDVLAEL